MTIVILDILPSFILICGKNIRLVSLVIPSCPEATVPILFSGVFNYLSLNLLVSVLIRTFKIKVKVKVLLAFK